VQDLFAQDASTAPTPIARARELFQQAGRKDWEVVCDGVLDLLQDKASGDFPSLVAWSATCEVIEEQGNSFSRTRQPGLARSEDMPEQLRHGGVFHQVSQLCKFLDVSAPVGSSWSGDSPSFSYEPLHTTVIIRTHSETVSVPAGTFDHCLLMEHVTTEGEVTDNAPESSRRLNRRTLCGTRRAWWAPGTGLVQLHILTAEGVEALLQLEEFALSEAAETYLPLAIGNSWIYGWVNDPSGYEAREHYRVRAKNEQLWYLEQYGFVRRVQEAGAEAEP
jgi:hypothetical protein